MAWCRQGVCNTVLASVLSCIVLSITCRWCFSRHTHHLHHHPQQSGCRACSDVVLYFSSYASEEIDMDSHTCSPVYQTSQTNKCFITKTNHILQVSLSFFLSLGCDEKIIKSLFWKRKGEVCVCLFQPVVVVQQENPGPFIYSSTPLFLWGCIIGQLYEAIMYRTLTIVILHSVFNVYLTSCNTSCILWKWRGVLRWIATIICIFRIWERNPHSQRQRLLY